MRRGGQCSYGAHTFDCNLVRCSQKTLRDAQEVLDRYGAKPEFTDLEALPTVGDATKTRGEPVPLGLGSNYPRYRAACVDGFCSSIASSLLTTSIHTMHPVNSTACNLLHFSSDGTGAH